MPDSKEKEEGGWWGEGSKVDTEGVLMQEERGRVKEVADPIESPGEEGTTEVEYEGLAIKEVVPTGSLWEEGTLEGVANHEEEVEPITRAFFIIGCLRES
jgi:hypothetical protein